MFDTTQWPEPEPSPRPGPTTWVVNPHGPPWQIGNAFPIHVAESVTVAYGPGLLRAADPPPRHIVR